MISRPTIYNLKPLQVGANRILNAPLRVAGAQDIVARSGIARIIRRIALPGNGALALPSGAFVTVMS